MTTISTKVFYRDQMGRFKADCAAAATEVVKDCLKAGIEASRSAAPVKTGLLRSSFYDRVTSRTSGYFGNHAAYAVYQDQGAAPHEMNAHVHFFWERMGRSWLTPDEYLMQHGYPGGDPIHHPGNPATHFMDKGIEGMRAVAQASMSAHYPG